MHWPSSTVPEDLKKHHDDWNFIDTWYVACLGSTYRCLTDSLGRREMQKLVGTGKVRNIGVSNFVISNLEKLLNDPSCKIVPAVDQIELHPNMPSPKTLQYCKEKGIHCTAYSCLGSTDSPLSKDKTLQDIAEAKGKSPQQVLLMWGLQRGK